MGARYYQPELGRWTQQDPSGLEVNAYLYVGANPVNLKDPSGYAPDSETVSSFATTTSQVVASGAASTTPASSEHAASLESSPVSFGRGSVGKASPMIQTCGPVQEIYRRYDPGPAPIA